LWPGIEITTYRAVGMVRVETRTVFKTKSMVGQSVVAF
jgi:hypothetical protein